MFGPVKQTAISSATLRKRQTSFTDHTTDTNGHTNGNGNGNGKGIPEVAEEEEQADGEDEERQSRPVIKLRASRHIRPLSRSRSRRDLSRAAEEDGRRPVSPDANDRESVANVRFSAHIVAKTDLSDLMPFALIAPEPNKRRPRLEPHSQVVTPTTASAASPISPAEQQQQQSTSMHEENPSSPADANVSSPVSVTGKNYAFLQQAHQPQDLKGVFVRKFRWGAIDVLDPNHCDFAALRTAVLSTHLKVRRMSNYDANTGSRQHIDSLKVLKTHTREVLYEKFRTEKLLARRATSNISDAERLRLLEGMCLTVFIFI